MDDQLVLLLITLIPAAASTATSLGTLIALVLKLKELRESIKEKTEMEELKSKMEVTLSQVRELQLLLIQDIEQKTRIRGGLKKNEQNRGVGNDKKI